MAVNKSLDPYKQILATLLIDVYSSLSEVISSRSLRLTLAKVSKRVDREGLGFLTKTLPRLGKALDRALSGKYNLDCNELRLEALEQSKLPKLFGELFQRVLTNSGGCLQSPCVTSIKGLRHILFVFYKLELPYSPNDEQNVIDQFKRTEVDILPYHQSFSRVAEAIDECGWTKASILFEEGAPIVRKARDLLARVFLSFSTSEILPRHGPGAVSTKEQLQDKYRFRRVNPRINACYPYDEYYCSSAGHVCDEYRNFPKLIEVESLAQVILVPKDSRGPRLISCEPLEFQWIQQALGGAIVKHIERHPLTKDHVHFTNQQSNQFGALLGSSTGRYATLDLKEASDRVSVGLVRLLFPKHVFDVLKNCRTLGTVLPDGSIQMLNKFAPMGSALCFPIMAITLWAILTAGATDADARDSVLVYGDDVIVESAQAPYAMKLLESFGLLCNQDKSYIQGLFRESCGVDAYNGVNVTPVRIHSLWTHHPSPDNYTSWIESSNNFYSHGYYKVSELIATWVCARYRHVPTAELGLPVQGLICKPGNHAPLKRRVNANLQRLEYLCLVSEARPIKRVLPGWLMLLRYFTEGQHAPRDPWSVDSCRSGLEPDSRGYPLEQQAFSVSQYTRRGANHLVPRWRG